MWAQAPAEGDERPLLAALTEMILVGAGKETSIGHGALRAPWRPGAEVFRPTMLDPGQERQTADAEASDQ